MPTAVPPPARRLVWSALGLIVLLILLYGAWAIVRPEKAPHAREQARLASHDPVWDEIPGSLSVSSDWTVLADASWVPLGGDSTGAGRWYSTSLSHPEVVAVVEQAARTAGWSLEQEGCDWNGPVVAFAKTMGRWPATLELSYAAGGDRVGISIHAGRSRRVAGTDRPYGPDGPLFPQCTP